MKPLKRNSRSRRREDGTAVIVVIALLSILLVYVAGNLQTLYNFQRELKLLEARQVKKLNNPGLAASGARVTDPAQNVRRTPRATPN